MAGLEGCEPPSFEAPPTGRRRTSGRRGGFLLPRRLTQRCIDAVLPTGAVLLEKIQHVAVDPQRHRLFHARQGDRRGSLRNFERLGRHRFEGLLGGGARIRFASRFRCVAPISRSVSRIVSSHGVIMGRLTCDAKRQTVLLHRNDGCRLAVTVIDKAVQTDVTRLESVRRGAQRTRAAFARAYRQASIQSRKKRGSIHAVAHSRLSPDRCGMSA